MKRTCSLLTARGQLHVASCKIRCTINLSFHMCLVSTNDIMEHSAFPGNIAFATDDQGAFSCIIHEKLLCLFIICETVFTIGESRTISHPNDTELRAKQVPANPCRGRFSVKTPLKNADLNSSGSRSKKTIAKEREHRLAQ